jgi:hypothetical protein
MPCPSIGPKLFWTVQIVLVGSKKFSSKRTDIFRNPKLHKFLILLLVGKKMLTNYCQEEFNSQFLPEKNQGRKHQVIVYVRPKIQQTKIAVTKMLHSFQSRASV